MDRRKAHIERRRIHHSKWRSAVILKQGPSASEGKDDSPEAQKAAKATKPRRA